MGMSQESVQFSQKEMAVLIISTALSVGGVRSSDLWVSLPMLVIAWGAFLFICWRHQGSWKSKLGISAVLTVVLGVPAVRIVYDVVSAVQPSTIGQYVRAWADKPAFELDDVQASNALFALMITDENHDPVIVKQLKAQPQTLFLTESFVLDPEYQLMVDRMPERQRAYLNRSVGIVLGLTAAEWHCDLVKEPHGPCDLIHPVAIESDLTEGKFLEALTVTKRAMRTAGGTLLNAIEDQARITQ